MTPTRTPSPLFDGSMRSCCCALLSDAYDTAKMLCEKYYLAAPKLKIEEFNSKMLFNFSLSSGSLSYAASVGKFKPAITMFTMLLPQKQPPSCYSLFKPSCLLAKAAGKPIQVVYVPSHLFHMLFELFKVSIRGSDSAPLADFQFN